MAEIKSTLDIIMERTKGLRMTNAEKMALREQETAGKIKGVVQKCLDGAMDLTRFQEEVRALKKELGDPALVGRILGQECLDRIEPEEDNDQIFGLLETTSDVDVPLIKARLREIQGRIKQERGVRESRLASGLEQKGIAGSAVMPNIHADPEWGDFIEGVKRSFKEEIGAPQPTR